MPLSDYKLTVGLEIHAELKTRTKMFCDSANDPEEKEPNVNICPVCMGHPGTLPTINKEAVRLVLTVGAALGGKCADFSEFDRKNYFYPDLPKGYQISQYAYPLVSGGSLCETAITRVHLEEDTARSQHGSNGTSLLDFNRAGVPLMELVTEPVIHDAGQASRFAKELQLLLRALNASDANMEKGQMRVEANISLSKEEGKLGTKVEVKNLNSFRAVERAIAFEVARQRALLEKGERVTQETRGWDENKQETFSQRLKEESHDYRYFPEPDLPKLHLSLVPEFAHDVIRAGLPELPFEKRKRYVEILGIKSEDAEMYVENEELDAFFAAVADILGDDKTVLQLASNYSTSDVVGLGQSMPGSVFENIRPEYFAELMRLVGDQKVSSRGAKDILKIMATEGGEPMVIAKEQNLLQEHDEEALRAIVNEIIREHPQVVAEYRAGKESVLQFLVGQGMKASKGAANPALLAGLFRGIKNTPAP